MGWILLYLGLAVALAYIGRGLLLLFRQPRLLYRPVRQVTKSPLDRGLAFEDAVFFSRDGVKLAGWYVPAAGARFTVLFCHGNGGNISHTLDALCLFHDMGLNCLAFDYRGYGDSEGSPTEAGTYLDARAAFDWLTQAKGTPAERIILCGRSLGGAIAAHLAAEVQPAGLALEGAFTSYADVGSYFYPYLPVRWFAWFRYDTLAYVERARCPVMVVHSKNDRVVPPAFGLRLFDAANEPKRFAEIAGGHNDGFVFSADRYKTAWTQWVEADLQPQGQTCQIVRPCNAASRPA